MLTNQTNENINTNQDVVHDISRPTESKHHISIRINSQTGKLEGIPPIIMEAVAKQGLTEEMIMQNPMSLKEILYSLDLSEVLKDEVVYDISAPISTTHHISVRYNKETKRFEGIPEEVRKAFDHAGLTDEEIMMNPEKVEEILKSINLEEIIRGEIFMEKFEGTPQVISPVTKAAHHISITYNQELGKFEGIPQAIIDAMAEKGIDEKEIFAKEHTETLAEILKTVKFDVIAGAGKPISVKSAMPVEKPNSQLSTVRGLSITVPTKAAHNLHVTYDNETREFKGIPEQIMSVLNKHGINSVTKENIQQVSSLLQSLDIPFDLLGQSKEPKEKPDSLVLNRVTSTPINNIKLVVSPDPQNSTNNNNVINHNTNNNLNKTNNITNTNDNQKMNQKQNKVENSYLYYFGVPIVILSVAAGYLVYKLTTKKEE